MAASRKESLKRPVNADKGGIETRPSQPLRKTPLRETYGARSGEAARKEGTPEMISEMTKGGKKKG